MKSATAEHSVVSDADAERDLDDGYTLTQAGTQVVGAAVSGVYTHPEATLDGTPIEECPTCESRMSANYESGHILLACTSCDTRITISAPPIVVEDHSGSRSPSRPTTDSR